MRHDDRLLTFKSTAELLSVHVNTVRRMTRDGRLPVVKLGWRVVRIPAKALDAILTTTPSGEDVE